MKAVVGGGGRFLTVANAGGAALGYGNAFGVESVQWEGAVAPPPPPFKRFPGGGGGGGLRRGGGCTRWGDVVRSGGEPAAVQCKGCALPSPGPETPPQPPGREGQAGGGGLAQPLIPPPPQNVEKVRTTLALER